MSKIHYAAVIAESGYIPFHPVYFHFVTNRADIDIFRRMVSI